MDYYKYTDCVNYYAAYNKNLSCREFLEYKKHDGDNESYTLNDKLHNIHMLPAEIIISTIICNNGLKFIIRKTCLINGLIYNNADGYYAITYTKFSINRTIHREPHDILNTLYILYMERDWKISYTKRGLTCVTWYPCGQPVMLNCKNPTEKLLYDAILKSVQHIK